MKSSILKTATFAALFTTAFALQGQVVHPFSDSACTNPVDVKANLNLNDVTQIDLGMGVGDPTRGFDYNQYDSINFVNATAPENGVGNWVWWKTGPIDKGCKVVFMTPFADGVNNRMWLAPDQAPGKVILTASQEGCVFTQLPVSTTLWTTFCCGDCNHWSGNAPEVRPPGGKNKREETLEHKREEYAAPVEKSAKAISAGTDWRPRGRSPLVPRNTCDPNDKVCADQVWKDCTINPGAPVLAAGLQVAVSQIQTATAGPGVGDSNIAASLGFTVGTSTSWSKGSSFSSSQGVDVSVKAGVSFPVEAETTVSASLSFTEEINQSTSHEDNNSKEETVTQTMSQVPGTAGFLSFTPYYDCYGPSITCGGETSFGLASVCYPHYDSTGKITGEYGIVTVS